MRYIPSGNQIYYEKVNECIYIEFVINGLSIIFCFFTVDSAQNVELRGSIVANYEYADSGPQVYSKLNHHLEGVEVMKDETLGLIASHRNPI